MDIAEKEVSLKTKRANSLFGKKGLNFADSQADVAIAFHNEFLFGDGTWEGVHDLIALYYEQRFLGNGNETDKPNVRTATEATWEALYSNALDINGDEVGGFYPPDGNNIGAQDLNTSSHFFTDNTPNGTTTAGIIGDLTAITTAYGTVSTVNAIGTGLLGRRTQLIVNITPPPDYVLGSYEHQDYYNEPERTAWLTSISNMITDLTTYLATATTLRDALQDVLDGNNLVFEKLPSMKTDTPTSDIATLDTLITDITNVRGNYQTWYTYFNGFTASNDISGQAGYVRATFDSTMGTVNTYDTVVSGVINTRGNAIPGIVGSTSYPFTSLRKWRYFWIAEMINKPVAPYITKIGVPTALVNVNKSVSQSNDSLSIFGVPTDEYITDPTMFAAYPIPALDLAGAVVGWSIGFTFQFAPHSNKVKVLRQTLSTASPSNAEWVAGGAITEWWLVDYDPNTEILFSEIEDLMVVANDEFIYRIQAFDTLLGDPGLPRLDSFNTSSIQTKVYEDDIVPSVIGETVVVGSLPALVILELSQEVEATVGGYLVSLTNNPGFYRVTSVSGTFITIRTALSGFTGGTVARSRAAASASLL